MADTQQRGALDATEFIIAMHFLTSYRSGAMKGIPQVLPPGLYDAAARRGSRGSLGSRPGLDVPPVPAIPTQFTGPQRTQSPINRQFGSPLSAQGTGGGVDWLVTPQEKVHYDNIFSTVDNAKIGLVSGDQAVSFFMNAQLPEETLAQIWDLADIDADGQLTKDEFAVAMYLVRQQRSGKQPLPQVLPLALIPPSMRGSVGGQMPSAPAVAPVPAPAATPAPAPAAAAAPSPRSAADDLFGLDTPVAPAQPAAPSQVPQSTGGSNVQFHTPTSPAQTSPSATSTTFKPFVPTSSFGQSLQPQMTGGPAPVRSPPPPADDLLGDNDPEESKKLTSETTDLANLSNQIGSLANEMQNVQTKRTSAEQGLSQSSQQKRDFEGRLSQARSMYEQEVKNFKALEERLNASKSETTKLQQEYALIEGSRQDLQNQYDQVSASLTADTQENASLKEKIREANAAVTQLKPALEKARSGARQQKGLVAINKKQLATVEGEQDKIRGEIDDTSKESERGSAAASPAPEASAAGAGAAGAAAGAVAAAATIPAVTSPAESATSQHTNPFFKKTATGTSGNESPALTPEVSKDQQRAFDSLFGPSFAPPSGATPPPPTSFRADSPSVQQAQAKSPVTSGAPTPSVSPPPSGPVTEPPPPAQSRQFTPNALPFGELQSVTSSTMVSPPGSNFGGPDTSGFATPSQGDSTDVAPTSAAPGHISPVPAEHSASRSPFKEAEKRFPDLQNAPAPAPGAEERAHKDPSFDELFGGPAHQRSQSQKASDFDEAFAAMKQDHGAKPEGAAGAASSEFPPIREFDDDNDSTDTEAPMGFDDNFTPAGLSQAQAQPVAPDQTKSFPPATATRPSQPPPPVAQTSPPTYDQSVPRQEPGDVPAEYNELLPRREEDPTTAPDAPHSVETTTGAPVFGGEAQHPASTKAGGPDFEAAFAGLNLAPAAKEAEDDDEEDIETPEQKNNTTVDFDFSFDSPSQQRPASPKQTPDVASSDFFSYDSNVQAPPSAPSAQPQPFTSQPAPGAPAPKPTSHDWDALFAPLDNINPGASGAAPPAEPAFGGGGGGGGDRKEPGWALNTDIQEDDLILQRLTGMGFPRNESLSALERFDYNIDKVGSLPFSGGMLCLVC